jgi:hypothetical protein
MSQKEVDDAVKFSIEDIEESLDLLEDDDYVAALYQIVAWCTGCAISKADSMKRDALANVR